MVKIRFNTSLHRFMGVYVMATNLFLPVMVPFPPRLMTMVGLQTNLVIRNHLLLFLHCKKNLYPILKLLNWLFPVPLAFMTQDVNKNVRNLSLSSYHRSCILSGALESYFGKKISQKMGGRTD